ncbi:MAG: RNA-binding S4 domain-containing protein [Paracoccaceae bacterium]
MAGPSGKTDPGVQPKLRLDKWLFHARFFKSRDLAQDCVESGHFRLNAQRCQKPGHGVAVGDVLTFPQGHQIRVVRVLALAERRGPATEAQALYCDLDTPGADASA